MGFDHACQRALIGNSQSAIAAARCPINQFIGR